MWSRDTLVRGQSSSSHISCGENDCHQLQGEDLIVYQRWMLTLVRLGSSGARGQHWLCPSTVAAPSRQPPSVSLVPSVGASAVSWSERWEVRLRLGDCETVRLTPGLFPTHPLTQQFWPNREKYYLTSPDREGGISIIRIVRQSFAYMQSSERWNWSEKLWQMRAEFVWEIN